MNGSKRTRAGEKLNVRRVLDSGKNSVNFDDQLRPKSLVRAKRTQYFHSLPSLLRSNSKRFWSVFKSTTKHSNIPGKMTWNRQDSSSTTAETPIEIANLLNRYFYSVFKPSCDSTHGLPIPVGDYSINLTTIADLELTEGEVCSVY
jgi:hypothetical protein